MRRRHLLPVGFLLLGLAAVPSVSAKTKPRDRVPPRTAIKRHPANPTKSKAATFSFKANERHVRFQCKLDGRRFARCSSPKRYRSLSARRHRFRVKATDRAGNTGRPAALSWRVDRTAPSVSIDERPSDPTSSAAASFSFSADEPSSFQCKLDSGNFSACTSPKGYSGLADGSHSFSVTATDRAGNSGTAASAAWAIDTAAPVLTSAEAKDASLTLTFDEALSAAPPPTDAFSVTVDGLRWRVVGDSVDGSKVVLQLGLAVNAGEAVQVTYGAPTTDPLADRLGNEVADFTTNTANSTASGAEPPVEPGYSPSIPKPSFADNHVWDWQPWVGEWGPKTDPYWLPSTGTLHGLIIPVDFSDAPATRTVEFYRDLLIPPSQAYYREDSYGRLALDLQILPQWSRMPHSAAEYAAQWGTKDTLLGFLSDATALVDSEVDFANVDSIYVVGPESVAGTLDLRLVRSWPGEGIVRDGKELRWAVLGGGGIDTRGPSENLAAHHIVTHETGHFLGLPDLYDKATYGTPEQFAWAGRWDIMSDNRASSHMFAWHKWLLGWLDPTQLRGLTAPGATEAELTPLERKGGLKAVVVPISSTVFYVIEDRQRIGEDIELCDKGVLVWIVDGSKANVDHNAVVQAAGHSYNDACGTIFDAGFDLGGGELSSLEDAEVRVDVLEALPNGNYRVEVTKK